MRRAFFAILRRELGTARMRGWGLGVAFLCGVVMVLPFGTGADALLLRRLAPGMIWIGILLASLLTMDDLFVQDHEDGSLDLLCMGAMPLEGVVTGKIVAHWLITNSGFFLVIPLLGEMLNLDGDLLVPLLGSVLAGTVTLSFLGAVISALTLGTDRSGLLLAVLSLPLSVPVLILGVSATMGGTQIGEETGTSPWDPSFTILVCLMCAVVASSPFAAAAALRETLR